MTHHLERRPEDTKLEPTFNMLIRVTALNPLWNISQRATLKEREVSRTRSFRPTWRFSISMAMGTHRPGVERHA
jgi:hypothetical protein